MLMLSKKKKNDLEFPIKKTNIPATLVTSSKISSIFEKTE